MENECGLNRPLFFSPRFKRFFVFIQYPHTGSVCVTYFIVHMALAAGKIACHLYSGTDKLNEED